MKKALATLDCVVVGVEVGHGKRHGVLSDYTFAVRDEATGQLVTIGKAYSGLTDAEIAEMTRWFEAHTISTHGRYRVVEPAVVVEVAFDVIMRSTRHRSGYALRFPRIANLRRGQAGVRDRHAGDRGAPVRGAPARRRAPGHRQRARDSATRRDPVPSPAGSAGRSPAPSPMLRGTCRASPRAPTGGPPHVSRRSPTSAASSSRSTRMRSSPAASCAPGSTA